MAKVVAGQVDGLVEDASRAQFEYVERCAVLNEVRKVLHPWSTDHKAVSRFVDAATISVHQHIYGGASIAAVEEWRQAVSALSRDATVRLPGPRDARAGSV